MHPIYRKPKMVAMATSLRTSKSFMSLLESLTPKTHPLALNNVSLASVVTVSKFFLSDGFGRFCRKNLGFRFGLGFHNKCNVNFS